MYSLLIKRYNRYQSFDTVEELREELARYLTKSQIASGLLARLTTFDPKRKNEDGLVVNNWQDFRIDCFID